MCKAYLTIDDSPTKVTPSFMDYLCAKGVTPVVNFIGANAARYPDEAVYAIRKGAIIGNHSYTHPHFSTLTLDECECEIRRAEEEIDRAYDRAGVRRTVRVFRFPYGDKGGANAARIQTMLRDTFRFDRLDDTAIRFPWWKENRLDVDTDMFWTFDFVEYQLPWRNGYTWESIIRRMEDPAPPQGGALLGTDVTNIVLIHDSEETEAFLPRYYQKLLDEATARNVRFIPPAFLRNAALADRAR